MTLVKINSRARGVSFHTSYELTVNLTGKQLDNFGVCYHGKFVPVALGDEPVSHINTTFSTIIEFQQHPPPGSLGACPRIYPAVICRQNPFSTPLRRLRATSLLKAIAGCSRSDPDPHGSVWIVVDPALASDRAFAVSAERHKLLKREMRRQDIPPSVPNV